ncbi:PaaI family thioesterase [Pedobacter mendelii]|uniref:PaaI family thioesterase n=1 Tax=Pedobacter mendelii TaxID=1908240 RepID=UPI00361438B5
MIISQNTLKWVMRLYPPLFFQCIWVQKFENEFKTATVKISKSFLNKNYNGSIFGGTIYAATDPFYALLFDQLMQRRGLKVRVWLKSASIQYLKPGRGNLYFTINVTDEMIAEAELALKSVGKFVKAYPMEITNKSGELCATVMNEVYIRNLHQGETPTVAY